MANKIYLAGPDVFLADAAGMGRRKQQLCREFGFEGLFPLDNQDENQADAGAIFRANCALMRQADLGLFNLTPFRGPSADAGTVFEVGFMFALGKPVFGYSSSVMTYSQRVAALPGSTHDRHSQGWDADGYAIEEFGLVDNLMIARAIADSGGVMAAIEEPDGEPLGALRAFRTALEGVRARLGTGSAPGERA